MNTFLRQLGAGLLLAFLTALMLTCGAELSHGATQPRPNSLGILQTYTSPWSYMVGAPVRASLYQHGDRYYTNVEFKALGASMLNTVPILFCGNQLSAFGDGRVRAVTYRTEASRRFQGIGCHDILPTEAGVIVLE